MGKVIKKKARPAGVKGDFGAFFLDGRNAKKKKSSARKETITIKSFPMDLSPRLSR